jgi:RNA-splicing ligase RtcB
MIVKGKYGKATVHADIFDESTKVQVEALLDQKFIKGSKVRIMPDCHSGTGCVIGTTMTIKKKVVPNLVGVDIGC